MNESLPDYAQRLAALHAALDEDFRRILALLPLARSHSVVDVGCGDGYFASLLSEQAHVVTAVDNSEAYLAAARTQNKRPNINFVQGDVRRLPFPDASVDMLWSGHSMQSYPDLSRCLREFHRVLTPSGTLAVLETDNIHSVMLSWPPDVELAVRQAEHREIGDEDSYLGTYFPRFADRLLSENGFEQLEAQYFLIQRRGRADDPLSEFVRLYLVNLLEKTSEHLNAQTKAKLAVLCDASSVRFLPRQRAFFFGSLQVLMLAKKTKAL